MASAFLFGGSTGETPETLARRRAIQDAIAQHIMGTQPTTALGGIGAMLQGLAVGYGRHRDSRLERESRDKASDFANGLLPDYLGGNRSRVTPGAGAETAAFSAPEVKGTMENARARDRQSVAEYQAKPDGGDLEAYIRQAAGARGIDPETALRVARSEGLAPGVWQSNVRKNGMRETSYGPFQLLVGDGVHFPKGMGNDFIAKTGLDPADPRTVYRQIDFALDRARDGGWSPWYGAKAAGISAFQGIDRNAPGADAAAIDGNLSEGQPVARIDPSMMAEKVQPGEEEAQRERPAEETANPYAGVDRRLIEALNNPWTPAEIRSVLQTVVDRQMKEADPTYRLGLEKQRIELDNLRHPRPAYKFMNGPDGSVLRYDESTGEIGIARAAAPSEPEAIRILRLRAEAAGLKPGTPEYQQFMRSGEAKPAGR